MSATVDAPGTRRDRARKSLSDEVASLVREQIMSGQLRPGQFLRMEPIAEAMAISITPVREGLVALSSEGFVTSVPRRGFVVASFSRQDVRDLFWVQGQLAGEIAARAALQITESELQSLAESEAACDAAIVNGNVEEIGRLGNQFHRVINLAARSDRLARLLARVVGYLPDSFYTSLEQHVHASTPAHAEIYEAISRRDAELARTLMRKHFEENADMVVGMLEERGLWQDDQE